MLETARVFLLPFCLFAFPFTDSLQNVSHVHEANAQTAAARGLHESTGGADHGVQADPSLHGRSPKVSRSHHWMKWSRVRRDAAATPDTRTPGRVRPEAISISHSLSVYYTLSCQ